MKSHGPLYVGAKDGYFTGVVERIRVAKNGYVDLVVVSRGDPARRRSAGWWCWWGQGINSVEGFIRRLRDVPGWTPEIEAVILAHRGATHAPPGWDGQSSEAMDDSDGGAVGPTLTGL